LTEPENILQLGLP